MPRDGVEKVAGLFAFWRHDQYPYVLGDEIEAMDDHGNVKPIKYGGRWFRAFKVLPINAGKAMNDKLVQLRAEKSAADALSDKAWNDRLFRLMPDARDPECTYAGFPRKVEDKR